MATGIVNSVVSADGTRIGYERRGRGPALLAVHGGTADRTRWEPVADALAERNTVYLMDRRGRGLSEDGLASYALAREAEDIAAVIAAIGEPVFLLGHSYGGSCVLETALLTDQIVKLLVYEPVFTTPGHVPIKQPVLHRIEELVAANRREPALEVFYRDVIGLAPAAIEKMRDTPIWKARIAAVHTIVREGYAVNANRVDPTRLGEIAIPVRFLVGTESPDYLRAATIAAARAVLGSETVELPGQGHVAIDAAPELFVRHVRDFLR